MWALRITTVRDLVDLFKTVERLTEAVEPNMQ